MNCIAMPVVFHQASKCPAEPPDRPRPLAPGDPQPDRLSAAAVTLAFLSLATSVIRLAQRDSVEQETYAWVYKVERLDLYTHF